MSPARIRLAIAVLLFAGWMAWLVSLGLTAGKPVVLSRPQFLVSQFDLTAQIMGSLDADAKVIVRDVHYPPDAEAQRLVGQTIRVSNLALCRDDWTGTGEYVLPLIVRKPHEYHVADLPASPGFVSGRPRIYRASASVLDQLKEILKRKPMEHHPPDL